MIITTQQGGQKQAKRTARSLSKHWVSYKKEKFNNLVFHAITIDVVAQKCFLEKMFSNILQNCQQNVCVRVSFLIKLQLSRLQL